MRQVFLALLICAWAGNASAQSSNALQAERLNPVDCMLAVQNLNSIFRSSLELKCLAIAVDTCVRRESGPECVQDTQGFLDAFYELTFVLLPPEIDATPFAERSYAQSIERIAKVFSSPAKCTNGSAIDMAMCQYMARATSTIDLMGRLRQASIDPNSLTK